MCAAKDDFIGSGDEIGAGASSFASANSSLSRAICVHNEDLLVWVFGLKGLEGDFGAIIVPVGFGVLATEGELSDICKMRFFGVCDARLPGWPACHGVGDCVRYESGKHIL